MSTTREKMIERGARAIAALPGGDKNIFDPTVVWHSPEALAAAVIDAIGGEEMVEALEPFAKAADKADERAAQVERLGMGRLTDNARIGCGVKFGHLRRARAALAKWRGA